MAPGKLVTNFNHENKHFCQKSEVNSGNIKLVASEADENNKNRLPWFVTMKLAFNIIYTLNP